MSDTTAGGSTVGGADEEATAPALGRRERLYEAVDRRLPYLMVAPALALVGGLMLYPVVWAFKLSLYDVEIYNLADQTFVGLSNYAEVFTNPFFYEVMVNSLVFVFASVLGQFGLGLVLALILDQDWLPETLTRTIRPVYIVPWATTGVIVAYSWQFMFNPQLGLVNGFLRWVGVSSPPAWLSSVRWAMVAVIVANVWRGVPFSLIFQTSGLQSIKASLYEAAEVGGASPLQTVRYVTLPQLRPFIMMNLILITLFTFNVFDIIFVMTGGGPLEATEVLSLHMYETAFSVGEFGRASALAVVLFVINVTMAGLYLFVLGGEGEGLA